MEKLPKFLGDPGMKFLGQYTYTVPAEQFVAVAVVVTAVGAAVVVTATVVVDAVVPLLLLLLHDVPSNTW